MSKKLLLVFAALLVMGVMTVNVMAQDTPSISVSDQISNGSVVIDSVYSDAPGWVVVRGSGGRGTPGPVLGQTAVGAGLTEDVVVELNLDLATRQLIAALHTDDNTEGTWDFGLISGADAPVVVDGEPVQQLFTAQVIEMADQEVAEDNTVYADTVVTNARGWLVIHADDNGRPGEVLGYAPLRPGRNADVVVELATEGRTDTLFAMLHVDTGAIGEYEFSTVEGADVPVMVNNEIAMFPISTVLAEATPEPEAAATVEATPEATAEPAATEAAAAGDTSGVCTIVAATEQGANIRSAPSMDGSIVSTLFGSTSRSPVGISALDDNGFRWFQLSDNTWVRADVVTTSGACGLLPVADASAEETPEATRSA